MRFIDEAITKLKKKYQDIALLRNEQFFKIYSFENGEPFCPDFVLFLTEKKTKQEVMYQIFVEPKGDHLILYDKWKEDFLLQVEKNYKVDLEIKNKDFHLIGLPFFNEGQVNSALREKFQEVFENKLLNNF